MSNTETSIDNQKEENMFETSVNDARWLFGFVVFTALAVFGAGLVASMLAA